MFAWILPYKAKVRFSKWLNWICQISKINNWNIDVKILNMQHRLSGLTKNGEIDQLFTTISKRSGKWLRKHRKIQKLGRNINIIIKSENALAFIIDVFGDSSILTQEKTEWFEEPNSIHRQYLSSLVPSEYPPKNCEYNNRFIKFAYKYNVGEKSLYISHQNNKNYSLGQISKGTYNKPYWI